MIHRVGYTCIFSFIDIREVYFAGTFNKIDILQQRPKFNGTEYLRLFFNGQVNTFGAAAALALFLPRDRSHLRKPDFSFHNGAANLAVDFTSIHQRRA